MEKGYLKIGGFKVELYYFTSLVSVTKVKLKSYKNLPGFRIISYDSFKLFLGSVALDY